MEILVLIHSKAMFKAKFNRSCLDYRHTDTLQSLHASSQAKRKNQKLMDRCINILKFADVLKHCIKTMSEMNNSH